MSRRQKIVVITRKEKRLKKTGHLTAFVLTAGLSAPVSMAKAAGNAAYNARTRRLQEEAAAAERRDVGCGAPALHEDRMCACFM